MTDVLEGMTLKIITEGAAASILNRNDERTLGTHFASAGTDD
jgi:hypothetical protein